MAEQWHQWDIWDWLKKRDEEKQARDVLKEMQKRVKQAEEDQRRGGRQRFGRGSSRERKRRLLG